MKRYTIRQGDYLSRLAHRHGFDAEAVWNHPRNAALQQQRPDPNLLCPGDTLWLPDTPQPPLALTREQANRYEARVPTTAVEIELHDAEGPLADEPYTVEGLGRPVEGTTDATGRVALVVPVHLRSVTVTLPNRELSYEVRVGDMDPIEERSGVRARLTNLGFHPSAAEAIGLDEDALLSIAIERFQRARDLKPTGALDADTLQSLLDEHGS